MSKPQNKTVASNLDPFHFISNLPVEKQSEAKLLVEMMAAITKSPPVMWGSTIIGFGQFHYKYDSGREGDWFMIGFSPRQKQVTVYLGCGMQNAEPLLANLGLYSKGVGCIYFKDLSDLHLPTFKKLMKHTILAVKNYSKSKKPIEIEKKIKQKKLDT